VVVVASGVVSSVVVGAASVTALTEVICSGGGADVAGDSTLKKIKQKIMRSALNFSHVRARSRSFLF
jgi:hypothetical protein